MPGGVVQIIIDDSTNKTVTGHIIYDRANGGTFIGPYGTTLPAVPEDYEWFLKTDTKELYFYDGAAWQLIAGGAAVVWGDIGGTLSNQTDLQNALDANANVNADWNAITGDAEILNKPTSMPPTLHAIAGSEHSASTLANLNLKITDATLDDLGDSRTPLAHDLSGALHNSTTLANLNLKISDATLDDSGDSRTPLAHDLAGTLHNSATLAQFNAKISDATLDDSGDARTPTQHALDSATLHSAPTDVTTFNATVSAHGLLPKLGGGTTDFLRADGAWAVPAGGGDVVGPASSIDTAIALFDGTTGKLLKVANVTIDANGNIYLNANGSSTASPRIFGAVNFSSGEAIRWEFGDAANVIQNAWGGAMSIGSYHTLILRGDRNTAAVLAFDTVSNIGVWVPNTVASSPALVVDGASGQSAALQQWRNSAATVLASIDASGNIVFASTQTVDGRDVSVDGSKLDGIEALADVTDEANVTDALDGAALTAATVAADDKVLIQDTSDSSILKTVTAQSIADLGGGGSDDRWLQAGNLSSVVNTRGYQFKNPKSGVNDSSSGWGHVISGGPYAYSNGSLDPFMIPKDGNLDSIRIYFSSAAVNATSVSASPDLRIELFKVDAAGTGRTSFGQWDIPLSPTGIGLNSTLPNSSPQTATLTFTNISVSAGDMIGWEFVNVTSTDKIAAVKNLQTSVHFVASS